MQQRARGQSFLEGAAILTAATLVAKLVGALFKIPLTNILGGVGMSYYTTAYDLFNPIYSLTVTGFGIAVSRMVAERAALGDSTGVEAVLRAAKRLFLVIGLVGMLVILALAPWLVKAVGNPASLFSVVAIAPTVMFGCISSVYRGYYQGCANMLPTAFSQVMESVVRLVLGILLAYGVAWLLLRSYTQNGQLFGYSFASLALAKLFVLRFAAAGAILGVTVSTAVGAVYIRHKYKHTVRPFAGAVPFSRIKATSRQLVAIAAPIALSTLVVNLSALIDLSTVMNCLRIAILKDSATILAMYPQGIPPEINLQMLPEYLYGSYAGLAYSIFNLIPAITAAFGASAIPAVSRAWAKQDRQLLTQTVSSILRMTMLVALPAGLGLSVLAQPILTFLYPSRAMEVSVVAPILQVMGISAVLVAAATPVNSILQSIGREKLPLAILLLGATIKLVTNYTLIQRPEINIQGVPYGTLLCYAVIIVLSTCALRICAGVPLGLYSAVLKPLVCAVTCSGAAWLTYALLPSSNSIKLVVSITIAVIIYGVMVCFTGAICKKDLKMLSVSENLIKRLEKLGLIG